MKKIFQNKSLLKSIQIFLICLVFLGGLGNIKNAEAAGDDILVIAYCDASISPAECSSLENELSGLGYTVTALHDPGAGVIKSTLGSKDYKQIYLMDISTGLVLTDNGDKTALANWYSKYKGNIVIDARSYGIIFGDPDSKLFIQNVAMSFINNNGRGLYIGTDHHPLWTKNGNALLSQLGYVTIGGMFPSFINGGDVGCELLTMPNIIGPSNLWVDTVGKAPTGIQPDGVNLEPLLWSTSVWTGLKTVYISYSLSYVPPLPSCTLTASPAAIFAGNSSTLTWTTANVATVTIDDGSGAVNKALNGNESVSPAATTTYTLTATNASGDTTTCSATVAIVVPPPPPLCDPSLNLFCNPLKSKTNSIAEGLALTALYLLSVAGVITLAFMVIAGIRYIISAGNPEKMKSAKDALFSAGSGLAIIVLSYTILSIIHGILSA